MNHQVQVFEIARDAKAAERPRAIDQFAVEAETIDGARQAAVARLTADGRTLRSLSFLTSGGLAAVVNPLAASATETHVKPSRGKR